MSDPPSAPHVTEQRLRGALRGGGVEPWRWELSTDLVERYPGARPGDDCTHTLEAFLDDIHPDDRGRVQRALARTARGEARLDESYRLVTRDGAVRRVLSQGSVERDAHGEPIAVHGVSLDVSHRLRGEHLHLDALVEHANDAVVAIDLDGTITYWNRGAERLFGYSRAEMVGVSASHLAPPDHASELPLVLARLRAGEEAVRLETVRRRRDGSRIEVSLIGSRILDANDELVGLAATIRDVSEQRAAERRVQRSEARLRAAFEQAPFAFLTYSAEGDIKSANARWYELWNAAPDALDGYNVLEDPQVDAMGMREVVERAFAGERTSLPPLHYDPSRVGRQADPRWIKVSFYPLVDEAGEVFEVVQVTDDLTEMMEAQAELERAAELERLAVASAGLGIWDYDLETRQLTTNAEAHEMIGLPDARPSREALLSRVDPDDRERVRQAFAIATTEEGDATCDVEFRLADSDGIDARHLRATARCLFRLSGAVRAPVRLVGMLQDTTEQHTAARRKDDYLAMLGHELRNPLAAIRTAAQLIHRHGHETALRAHVAEVLERQSLHMARLLDGLLDVSRIARGKVTLDRRAVDLAALLREVDADRQHDAQARRISLVFELGTPTPLVVDGDPVRLRQVFDNLVGNALKFTPSAGTVAVTASGEGDDVVVTVRDTGVGFDPRHGASLFEAFEQGPQDLSRQAGGLGLGLSLARGLIELHGGTIEGHSEGQGQGATFTVRLPRLSAQAAPPPVSGAELEDHGLRLLVVEDNADAAEMMRLMLSRRGHTVTLASHAELALELAADDDFDAVVCDIGLPGPFSGLDVARRLRAAPRTHNTPLAAVTGYGRPEDRQRCLDAGFDAHFTKPLDIDVLDRTLSELVARCTSPR